MAGWEGWSILVPSFQSSFSGLGDKGSGSVFGAHSSCVLAHLGRKFECRGRKIRGNSKSNISTTPYVLRIQNCFPAQEVWDISAPLRVCFFFFPGRLNRGRT